MPVLSHSRTCSMQTEARPRSVFVRPANAVVAAFKGTLRSVRAATRAAVEGGKKNPPSASAVSDDVKVDCNGDVVQGKCHDSKAASTSTSTELNVLHDLAPPTVAGDGTIVTGTLVRAMTSTGAVPLPALLALHPTTMTRTHQLKMLARRVAGSPVHPSRVNQSPMFAPFANVDADVLFAHLPVGIPKQWTDKSGSSEPSTYSSVMHAWFGGILVSTGGGAPVDDPQWAKWALSHTVLDAADPIGALRRYVVSRVRQIAAAPTVAAMHKMVVAELFRAMRLQFAAEVGQRVVDQYVVAQNIVAATAVLERVLGPPLEVMRAGSMADDVALSLHERSAYMAIYWHTQVECFPVFGTVYADGMAANQTEFDKCVWGAPARP
ncbi:hypothetical protein GGF31_002790 [Allomyces arbusculus]|nr:hypothetical protein GGF31_002790 [Allomyces arbusculus]